MNHSLEEKRLTHYILSRTDFVQAKCLAAPIERGTMESTLVIQMCEYLTTLYARPFMESRPFGRLEGNWKLFKTQEHQEMHIRLMDSRNRESAHNDMANKHVFLVKQNMGPYLYSGIVEGPTLRLDRSELSVVVEMCTDLDNRLQAEIQSLIGTLYPNETRNTIQLLEPISPL